MICKSRPLSGITTELLESVPGIRAQGSCLRVLGVWPSYSLRLSPLVREDGLLLSYSWLPLTRLSILMEEESWLCSVIAI